MPLTANIVESFNITQQKNSSSNIFPHSLTVALNLTIQGTSNVLNMSPLVLTLIRKYKDLDKEKIEKQRRLATVGINYLFNFRKLSKEFNKTVLKIISWIKTTSIVPELGIIRELNAYFLAVYEGNISVSTNIKNVLKISGYQNLANDLPN